MGRWALVGCVLAVGCHDDSWLQYTWDDRDVLCSMAVDDYKGELSYDDLEDQLRYAAAHDSVALIHAHVPGETISIAGLERILDRVEANGLDYVTYSDFATGGAPRAGVALCFDDQGIIAWYAQRELLRAHGARVTFFATRYAMWTDEQHGMLAELAADGHDVQAHGVNHLNAPDYVDAHGMQAYLDDEALPSIEVLEADGYAVSAFAFPFGASNETLDAAMLEHVGRVRVSPGSCPY
jgi:peptidoglycan/xylan/chitin deacetylase (PgdA/CDA1 family)